MGRIGSQSYLSDKEGCVRVAFPLGRKEVK